MPLETENIAHLRELSDNLSSICWESKCSDVSLILSGEKIPAHKAILIARSAYFEKELETATEIVLHNVQTDAFKTVLKYIYTGRISLTKLEISTILIILRLAQQYLLTSLQNSLIEFLKEKCNLENVVAILNAAHIYQMEDLITHCETFLDTRAKEIIVHCSFCLLSEASLVGSLKRDSFAAPEKDIFEAVAKWSGNDREKAKEVIKYVRLRGLLVIGKNVASYAMGARYLNGKTNVDNNYYMYHAIPETIEPSFTGIMLELKEVTLINNIQMFLFDKVTCAEYSYYIEVSTDKISWTKVVDYSSYWCRSYQDLYFERCAAKYVNIVGTRSFNSNNEFRLVGSRVYCRVTIPRVNNFIVYPVYNVASLANRAIVLDGDNTEGFTTGSSIIILLAQPYMITCMEILLPNCDDDIYNFKIESKLSGFVGSEWKLVDKRSHCKSRQTFYFEERCLDMIRIISPAADKPLRIVHFEYMYKPPIDNNLNDQEASPSDIFSSQEVFLDNKLNDQEASPSDIFSSQEVFLDQ